MSAWCGVRIKFSSPGQGSDDDFCSCREFTLCDHVWSPVMSTRPRPDGLYEWINDMCSVCGILIVDEEPFCTCGHHQVLHNDYTE